MANEDKAHPGNKPIKPDVTVGNISIDGDGDGGWLIIIGDRDPWRVSKRESRMLMIALTAAMGHEAFSGDD